MRFLLDQSTDARLATFLNDQGHDAVRIGQEYPSGLADEKVLAIAAKEDRILITNDRDFGELVFAKRQKHTGVIYLRLFSNSLSLAKTRLQAVLTLYADRIDRFLVVTPANVRERR